jgi:hypothetical protein
MPTSNNFYDFVEPGWVSVWIGEFCSEDAFDSYKTRPTFHFLGDDPGYDHWRLHHAERPFVGPRQGPFKGNDDELFDAYRKAYRGLDDIRVDVRSPNGKHKLGSNVSPAEGVDLIENWLRQQGRR